MKTEELIKYYNKYKTNEEYRFAPLNDVTPFESACLAYLFYQLSLSPKTPMSKLPFWDVVKRHFVIS